MFRLFLLAICVSATSIGHSLGKSSEALDFRKDYVYKELAGGWMKLHRSPATWFEARQRCRYEGSSVLASPLHENLEKAMLEVMGHKAVSIFTGISSTIASGEFFPEKDMSPTKIANGEFFSVEGVPFDDIPTRWGSEEFGNHHCIAMKADGSLTDVDCSQSRPYICYKEDTQNIPPINECGTNDKEYIFEEKTGQCYKFHKKGKTWIEAFSTCTKEGGYLAIINNSTEAEVLKSIMEKYPKSERDANEKDIIGVGLLSMHIHGGDEGWRTVHGAVLNEAGYSKWESSAQINADLFEFCGAFKSSGELVDYSCRSTISFICEMDNYDQQQ